jgi:hypothetical protein
LRVVQTSTCTLQSTHLRVVLTRLSRTHGKHVHAPIHPSPCGSHSIVSYPWQPRRWKHVAGITSAAPAFSRVSVAPQVHPLVGPASVAGTFSSPSGPITSNWTVSDGGGAVSLSVSLPIGVEQATVVVPKPFTLVPAPPRPLCATAGESPGLLSLDCGGGATISSVDFASFGTPHTSGPCETWAANASCSADERNTTTIIEHSW